MNDGKWIRWVCGGAAALILAIIVMNRGFPSYGASIDVFILLCFMILPPFIAIFLSGYGRFWWVLPIGLWCLAMTVAICEHEEGDPETVLLVLCAVTICMAPFLNLRYRSKKRNTDKTNKPQKDNDDRPKKEIDQ